MISISNAAEFSNWLKSKATSCVYYSGLNLIDASDAARKLAEIVFTAAVNRKVYLFQRRKEDSTQIEYIAIKPQVQVPTRFAPIERCK